MCCCLNFKDVINSGASRISSATCLFADIVLEQSKESRLCWALPNVSCHLAQLLELRCLLREPIGRAQRQKVKQLLYRARHPLCACRGHGTHQAKFDKTPKYSLTYRDVPRAYVFSSFLLFAWWSPLSFSCKNTFTYRDESRNKHTAGALHSSRSQMKTSILLYRSSTVAGYRVHHQYL
jgi:hypothetical protein